ncbi:MAG: Methylthioribose-1-phosphate isomerase [Sodalis sp.]|nr:MAG: Methylthioribose-1-phosphate isomerase [Sodalis sp.]
MERWTPFWSSRKNRRQRAMSPIKSVPISLAVLARWHRVPFYVAAPHTICDISCPSSDVVSIEQRDAAEVTGEQVAFGADVYNPALDVTRQR